MSVTPASSRAPGDGDIAHLGKSGIPLGPGPPHHQDAVLGDGQIEIVAHVQVFLDAVEDEGRALVVQQGPAEAAETLTTAPSGHRFPRSTTVPEPAGWKGRSKVAMTSSFQQVAPSMFSPTVRPVTVIVARDAETHRARPYHGQAAGVEEVLHQERPAA